MNGRRVRNLTVSPALGLLVLGGALTGCSTGEAEPPVLASAPTKVDVGRVCAGLLEGEGGEALKRVLESEDFRIRDEGKNPDVRAVAQAMADAYRSGGKIRDMPVPICEAVGSPKEAHTPTVRISFSAYSKLAGDPPDSPGAGDSGVRVAVEPKQFLLAYDCVSVRVGSTPELPLRIRLRFQERWDESKGEAVLRPDYAAVTHSAALAVAKGLGCVDGGGLPDRADGLPAPATGT
ncbi:hypothetical protein ACIOD1_30205 [Streptomyces sp. NPDC088097]|uniref:hypothetical protein n=1 Tax=Streptomyces sp. NPDC088097 TaxID=3365823 RepID=UPI00381A1ED7